MPRRPHINWPNLKYRFTLSLMPILVRLFSITVVVVIERQSALFVSILLPLNLLVYAPGLYALIEVLRQFYLLLYISRCLLRPAWPNNGPTMSTKYYNHHIVISTARALKISGLKVYSGNSDSNALIHRLITSRHSRPKISTGKIYSLIK